MGRSGTSAIAVCALSSHFCYVGVPTLRGVSGDVVTTYAYQDTKGSSLQSLALLRAGHHPCRRHKMAVSSNNGLVNEPVHNLLMQCCTLGSSKTEVLKTHFHDIVTT